MGFKFSLKSNMLWSESSPLSFCVLDIRLYPLNFFDFCFLWYSEFSSLELDDSDEDDVDDDDDDDDEEDVDVDEFVDDLLLTVCDDEVLISSFFSGFKSFSLSFWKICN